MINKSSQVFEKGNRNGNWEKIEKWIEDEDVCALDLMAIVCAKFGSIPAVRAGAIKKEQTEIMVAGIKYKITIEVSDEAKTD